METRLAAARERRANAQEDGSARSPGGIADIDGCIAVLAYLDDTIVGVPAELAGEALPLAVETFSRAGHTVHPGKSACWSHSADRAGLPNDCQRIWQNEGLKVGGIPVFNASQEPLLAQRMMQKRIDKVENEAQFLLSTLFDDQNAAADSWCRVQAVLLLLRYSLSAKLIYFCQTIDPVILQPFARRFDDIVFKTFLQALEIDDVELSEDQKLQIQLALREGGCGMRSHDLKELQRLFVASALLVAPAVRAATGERINTAAPAAAEGGTYEYCLSSCIRDIVAYGGTAPDFDAGGPLSANVWADSIARKFNKINLARVEHLYQMKSPEDRDRAKARLKSCSGVGAQWFAALPTGPKTSFRDEDFRLVTRFRLGLPTNSLEVCPHVSAAGAQCESPCDDLGYHLIQCPSGGGFFIGHDTVCAEFGELVGGNEGLPGVVTDWKAEVDAWPRSTRGYEADVGFYHIPGERDLYIDGVIALANPQSYRGCQHKAGKVADYWARRKNAEHPVFDRNTGRRSHPFDFRALSFERHGFIAKETVGLIRKFAAKRAEFLQLERSEETRRWYTVLSCCVQRANAVVLRGEAAPGRRSRIPRRLLAGNYDLPACGS